MSGEQRYIARVLHMLEERLSADGFRSEAQKVCIVARKLSTADLLDQALDTLYCVEGWHAAATRLMWFTDRARQIPPGELPDEVTSHRVQEIYPLVLNIGRNGQKPVPILSSVSRGLAEALHTFGRTLEKLKMDSYEGDQFKGIPKTSLERGKEEASVLQYLATSEGNQDLARFAGAFLSFLDYVIQQDLPGDLRVIHFISGANLTLQTTMQAVGEEDFDSLNQTIELLQNPRILLG